MKRYCERPGCTTILSAHNPSELCFSCQSKQTGARFRHSQRVAVQAEREPAAATPEPEPVPNASGVLYVITINGRPTEQFQAMYSRKLKAESALRIHRPVVSDRARYKIIKYRLTGYK